MAKVGCISHIFNIAFKFEMEFRCKSLFDTSNHPGPALSTTPSSSSQTLPSSFSHSQFRQLKRDLSTDLRLGLSLSPSASHSQQHNPSVARGSSSDWAYSNQPKEEAMNNYAAAAADEGSNDNDDHTTSTFYVKVYMAGHAIGRKLDLLAHDGGDEVDRVHSESGRDVHVLTYEDEEGDWLMDVLVRSEKIEDHKDFSMLIFTSSPSSKSRGFEFLGRAKSSECERRTVEIFSLER
ncbi:indole-3-acetic acid inducible 30 [Prunus dulcis]|uniref:Indole-3-acetic acid inducible 30 n=1 Tax=Prunus dulcis TaxID=3755 RepID=A0A4Y1R346_PRUDU|nr:indole-3-acetic acid inducible 30 [Prunus dulcis]